MENLKLIQITLELWGAVFAVICSVTVFLGRAGELRRSLYLAGMLMLDALLLCSDAIAWAYRGNMTVQGYYLVRISNFIVFAINPVLLILATAFCMELIRFNGGTPRRTWFMPPLVIGVIDILILIVSQKLHLYYSFDAQNLYQRESLFVLSTVFAFAQLMCLLALIIRYRSYFYKGERYALLGVILLPVCSSLIQTLYYGISLNNIAVTISMMLLFISHEVEKSRRLVKQEQILAEQQIQLSRKNQELAEKRNQIAVSQMRPHFLFNVLGSIEQLCKHNPETAATAIHNFAKYLRSNLHVLSSMAPVSFQEELEHIRTYVWLEKMRFGEELQVVEDLEVTAFRLPELSVQPLVENAIKHGMKNMKEDTLTVRLQTRELADCYRIIVEDNGGGFVPEQLDHEDNRHIGLANVRERIALAAHGTLHIESARGMGTRVIVELPKEDESDANTGRG